MWPLRFFNPFAKIDRHRNFLPHWQQPGATFFVTFRLADSIPVDLQVRWRAERAAWLTAHPEPWSAETEREYSRKFSVQFDRWLDAGHGECWLRKPEVRSTFTGALRFFDGDRYALHAWVAMPNHAHVLFSLHAEARLEDEVGAWKSVSARRINRLLARRGTLWQEDYFDRLVRDERHFERCVRYIRANPEKAHLGHGEYEFWEGKLALGVGATPGTD